MLVVVYAFYRQGVMTALTMTCNVFAAGLVAFNFWEPIAAELDPLFAGSFLHGYEDSLCLVLLFSLTLGLLRWATNNLACTDLDYPPVLQQGASALFGLVTGYLTAGFLVCVLQTLPWHENFMGFQAKVEPGAAGEKLRRVLPPDRVWLALMQRASQVALSRSAEPPAPPPSFDRDGSFELRYQRHRRYTDDRDAQPDQGELSP
jgi:hypothetical protein